MGLGWFVVEILERLLRHMPSLRSRRGRKELCTAQELVTAPFTASRKPSGEVMWNNAKVMEEASGVEWEMMPLDVGVMRGRTSENWEEGHSALRSFLILRSLDCLAQNFIIWKDRQRCLNVDVVAARDGRVILMWVYVMHGTDVLKRPTSRMIDYATSVVNHVKDRFGVASVDGLILGVCGGRQRCHMI